MGTEPVRSDPDLDKKPLQDLAKKLLQEDEIIDFGGEFCIVLVDKHHLGFYPNHTEAARAWIQHHFKS